MAWLASPATAQRFLGFTLGAGTGVALLIDGQRYVWRNAAEVCELYGYVPPQGSSGSLDDVSVWGPKTRAYLAQSWNRGIDNTLGALSVELAKRGL
mmetsp:Transcript_12781/g.34849  ORF Transcript_12781/g.34849 Transcript_12781/m.34849 type:complete len:96 (-) Transcript_12781:426-713(-)|eukprot:CAMPEP_0202351806 /NCGR_PEP_ID=MMETSP1126-20121109/8279_1 /ASSEMBLY_ACC=CAM_ASM_000457 /TAXON_ID=3047 /ORGANISM="Dunaliella tertiolecta, Strain CCMP1320" /LENGTH=95 /DNA_ID=CAMNT_0048943947 /DNA_START=32 /DNA_END=319 /DNA_ORIENTATION=+